jgi:hypothetical protein
MHGSAHAGTHLKSKGEIKRMQDSYYVTIPPRTRNIVRKQLSRWFARAKNPKEQMRIAKTKLYITLLNPENFETRTKRTIFKEKACFTSQISLKLDPRILGSEFQDAFAR